VTPDEINRQHGKPVWRCWCCKAENGLHWWNALSVAVCNKTVCHDAYRDFLSEEARREEAFRHYVQENAPW